MLFISNKYYQWYESIISKAVARNIETIYFERHHIIPRSLKGSNDPSNLVKLTPREHFICHLILPKIVSEGKGKMINALWRMMHPRKNRYRINSHTYEHARKSFVDSKLGVKMSNEVKVKISNSKKGTMLGEDNSFYGEHHSLKTIDKIKQAKTGVVSGPCSEERKNNISKAKKGKPLTEEHKKALAITKKGKPWTEARKNAGRKVMTPGGIFNSMAEAERALGLGANCVSYRIKTNPSEYYFVQNSSMDLGHGADE